MIIRMALDLNMHRTGKVDMSSIPEWRVNSVSLSSDRSLARTLSPAASQMRRTWLICMMVEKTMAVSMGKPSLLWSHGIIQVDLEEDPTDSLEDVRVFTATEYSQLLERTLDTTVLMRSLTSMDNDLPDSDALFQRQLENWRERGEKRERARDGALPGDHACILWSRRWRLIVACLAERQKALQRARYKLCVFRRPHPLKRGPFADADRIAQILRVRATDPR